VKIKEVSHIRYEDIFESIEIRDRADGIERGINKFLAGEIKSFKIIEETKVEKLED